VSTGAKKALTCLSCKADFAVEYVTVRVYFKRKQHEYRYRLCGVCKDMLVFFLRENCEYETAGLFQPPPQLFGNR
jgi:hypothetical protein